MERLLPTAEELTTVETGDLGTELHWMSGPSINTPEWVIESWKKAATAREAAEESI
jgi:hypothetical protein